ncbi:glycosyltransferase family 2 protein [Zhouia sp. PK063]|uniref:glycosyltransferase family 2 protein n=1 Tax=Zhouia sp. PK063 TaxID=3373602 RepID=UPI00378D38BC
MAIEIKFSILITTKNRLEELKLTLQKIAYLLERSDVECLIYDDASEDGTFAYIKTNYPNIIRYQNKKSKGLIHNRNFLLNTCKGDYAISLDDDAHFLTDDVLEEIENYFIQNPKSGVIAFRIFWGIKAPNILDCTEKAHIVNSFVGCGHVWNMQAWQEIPNYPEWFIFYGEEQFASYQLFKKGWEVHYNPYILIHHRVDINRRKQDNDYQIRTRRSLRSGWYLYFMFFPWKYIPRKLAYTFYVQVKNKTLKGDFKATFAILQAICDTGFNLPKLIKHSNRLSCIELNAFSILPDAKIYWKPEK